MLIQTGKAFTAKGMHVLEQVGKDTMDLIISETGILVDNKSDGNGDEDQLFEEISFDRCFYIYGGPEQLEVYPLALKYPSVTNLAQINACIIFPVGIGGTIQPLCIVIQPKKG